MAKPQFSPQSSRFQNLQHNDYSLKNINLKKTLSLLSWLLLASFILLLFFTFSFNGSLFPHGLRLTFSGKYQGGCDLFDGKWVRDDGRRMYTNVSCRTLPESKNCGKYGKDEDFVNWKWKPNGCELQRFDGERFLRLVRGKRMAFVGDSVSRNHMESLLCLLSQVESPIDIQRPDSEDKFRTWYFRSHDFIVMSLWTRFLVSSTERTINGTSNSGVFDIHLDKIDPNWTEKLPWINYLIISDGHWFFRKNYLYENNALIGCIYCSEKEENMTSYGPAFGIKKVVRTALEFIDKCENCDDRMVTLVRTFAPAHFEDGNWNGGGYCNRTRPLGEGEVRESGTEWEIRSEQVDVVKKSRKRGKWGKLKKVEVLDVTKAMLMRPDGHPGTHWNNQWMRGYSDCVHWCMPGPVDMWNELLLRVLLNRVSSE